MNIDKIEQWPVEIGGGYWFDKDGILLFKAANIDKDGNLKNVTEEKIANFTPILIEQRIIDNGVEIKEGLVFRAYRARRLWEEITTDTKRILGATPQADFGAGCRVYLGRQYLARLREVMQIQCEHAERSTVYQHTGYALIDGKRVFLNGEHSVTAEGLTDRYNTILEEQLTNYCFTAERHEKRFETLLQRLPAVGPQSLVYAALGLSFLTPLNALLREIGAEPCFVLYFTGKTGARKSTLARLFLNFFGKFDRDMSAPAGFRDTPNAIEKKFALTDSTLVLLDDRIPSTTLKVKQQMETVEQNVARQIGDRSGRARMNADGTMKAVYRPKCNLIITAEESFSNVGESAIARAISVEWKPDDIDLEALTAVQANAKHLNECMGDYIQYVIQNWDRLKEQLGTVFTEYRKKAQNGGHGRLAETVAHLQIGITIMCQWLLSLEQISAEQALEIESRAWSIFMKLSEEQNRRITAEKPVKLFMDALREMLARGTVRFVDISKERIELHSDKVIGFRDANFCYAHAGALYTAVRRYYADQDTSFPLSDKAIFRELVNDGIVEPGKDQPQKVKSINGKNKRYLWLKVEYLDREEVNESEQR